MKFNDSSLCQCYRAELRCLLSLLLPGLIILLAIRPRLLRSLRYSTLLLLSHPTAFALDPISVLLITWISYATRSGLSKFVCTYAPTSRSSMKSEFGCKDDLLLWRSLIRKQILYLLRPCECLQKSTIYLTPSPSPLPRQLLSKSSNL